MKPLSRKINGCYVHGRLITVSGSAYWIITEMKEFIHQVAIVHDDILREQLRDCINEVFRI